MAYPELDEAKIYEQLCIDIRATDEISFKLLGLVPLVSGAALVAVILSAPQHEGLLILLSLFAAAVTLGLFRWELRNIQTCRWLIRSAEDLEERALRRLSPTAGLLPQPRAPQRLSKRHAIKWIYTITVLTWLALPVGVGVWIDLALAERLVHGSLSMLLGGLAIWSAFADIEVARPQDSEAASPATGV